MVLSGDCPDDVEDGILTARELAKLDLSYLNLVVLSACQTRLGEISTDGVMGLQRGFKKVGAHSLMMSL
ncbi:CHAT domain-containing protein [Parabacteroides sp. AD58]|uniref:CHAT domain-containing protein n=1 Tax=Parabacteroides absconsus TaxID=2951805 RepID=A0ABZ2IQ36_9BACT|nr:CHAT domain-containing protein [Parabacteroides sp. AD58]